MLIFLNDYNINVINVKTDGSARPIFMYEARNIVNCGTFLYDSSHMAILQLLEIIENHEPFVSLRHIKKDIRCARNL
jgi:hypothetical protein